MLVEDIMSRDPLYVEDSTYLTKARQIIRDHHVRGLPVLSNKGTVLGIITSQDMLRVTSTKSNVTVSGYVVSVPTVTGKTPILEAARIMLKEKKKSAPGYRVPGKAGPQWCGQPFGCVYEYRFG